MPVCSSGSSWGVRARVYACVCARACVVEQRASRVSFDFSLPHPGLGLAVVSRREEGEQRPLCLLVWPDGAAPHRPCSTSSFSVHRLRRSVVYSQSCCQRDLLSGPRGFGVGGGPSQEWLRFTAGCMLSSSVRTSLLLCPQDKRFWEEGRTQSRPPADAALRPAAHAGPSALSFWKQELKIGQPWPSLGVLSWFHCFLPFFSPALSPKINTPRAKEGIQL